MTMKPHERDQKTAAIRQRIESIRGQSADAVVKGNHPAKYGLFKGSMPFLEEAITLANEIHGIDLKLLPDDILYNLDAATTDMANAYMAIANYTPASGADEQQWNREADDLARSLDTMRRPVYQLTAGYIAEQRLRSLPEIATVLENAMKKMDEVATLAGATRQAIARSTVARFATDFEKTANEHARFAGRWLCGSAMLAAVTVATALAFLFYAQPVGEMTSAPAWQTVVTKVVVVSIFYYAAVWSSRMYRAHRHLAVVNKHRQNALETFQAFTQSADKDSEIKNAVLLETTRCIFSPGVSGYLKEEEENPASRIVEVLKTFGPSGKGG
jgi:hypothetical protein